MFYEGDIGNWKGFIGLSQGLSGLKVMQDLYHQQYDLRYL